MQNKFKPKAKSFKNTFCVFIEVDLSAIKHLDLAHCSKSGSKYYYSNDGMYRLSNHWGRLANSKWRLESNELIVNDSKLKLGYASFSCFLPDNNVDKLYYLEYNSYKKTINYQHKSIENSDKKAVLRTTNETRKRIKQARNILILENWTKYFEYENLDLLRSKIIHELIYTEDSLEEIKRRFQ